MFVAPHVCTVSAVTYVAVIFCLNTEGIFIGFPRKTHYTSELPRCKSWTPGKFQKKRNVLFFCIPLKRRGVVTKFASVNERALTSPARGYVPAGSGRYPGRKRR